MEILNKESKKMEDCCLLIIFYLEYVAEFGHEVRKRKENLLGGERGEKGGGRERR